MFSDRSYYRPEDFGTIGSGDVSAIVQNCLDTAFADNKGVELINAYNIETQINIPGRLKITGIGTPSDNGASYMSKPWPGVGPIPVNPGARSPGACLLQQNPASHTLWYQGDQPILLEDFAIIYPVSPEPYSGVTAIGCMSEGVNNLQNGSVFSRLFIRGPDRGITTLNCISWSDLGCWFFETQTYGHLIDSFGGPYSSYGDWFIGSGATFWSGSTAANAHICNMSGSGGKIVGVKMNEGAGAAATTSYGYLVSPDGNYEGVSIEPPQIVGCSIEGCWVGVRLSQSPVQDGSMSLGTIEANQFWCVQALVSDAQQNKGPWIHGLNFSNNQIQCQITDGRPMCSIDGMDFVSFVNNGFNNQAGQKVPAFAFGSNNGNLANLR
jgi:hypothetical protein